MEPPKTLFALALLILAILPRGASPNRLLLLRPSPPPAFLRGDAVGFARQNLLPSGVSVAKILDVEDGDIYGGDVEETFCDALATILT